MDATTTTTLRLDPGHPAPGPLASDRVLMEFGVTLCERSALVHGYWPGSDDPRPVEITDQLALRMIRDQIGHIIELAGLFTTTHGGRRA